MPTPTQLTESHDIKLGGGSVYESWYDCGFTTPFHVTVAQSNRGSNSKREWRWFAVARLLTPAVLTGQAERMTTIEDLAKSDMTVRELPPDADADAFLEACRVDAALLAERVASVLGVVKTDNKKR